MAAEKVCTDCNVIKPLSLFGEFTSRNTLYTHNICKECKLKQYRKRLNSNTKSYLQNLLKLSKSRSVKRTKKGRISAGDFSITTDHILKLHEDQKGLCYYSKIPYALQVGVDFQCSLERLDPSQGYVPGNIALVILELNGVKQWTVEKFDLFRKLINERHAKQNIDFSILVSNNTITVKQRIQRLTVDGKDYIICSTCKNTKPVNNFSNNRCQCKDCRTEIKQSYYNTPRGHLQNLLGNMKKNTKDRNDKGRNHACCEYSFDTLVNLWETQDGLCAYSGIPMTFGSYGDKNWTCSVERIDNTKGYLKGNVCLICYEFNTNIQWSKEKIDLIQNM